MDDVIGKLLEENNMPDTPTARAIYRKMLERHAEDDDIQDYKRPWVGLTPEDILTLLDDHNLYGSKLVELIRATESKTREKNT
jgi:hypothetical protein